MIQDPSLLLPAQPPTEPIPFALIGWGWRAQQFAEIAKRAPAWFRLTSLLRQNPDGTEPVKVAKDLDELLQTQPRFVVLSVPRTTAADLMIELTQRTIPVLAETPPAADLDDLQRLWRSIPAAAKIQVAEQYPLQPYHMAAKAVIASGRLGRINHVQVSVAHDYHGIALARHFLNVGLTPTRLKAFWVVSEITAGPGREGPPLAESIQPSYQLNGLLDFGAPGTALYDFTGDQYMSWIRSSRLLIRGNRGELANDTVRWLPTFNAPARQAINRFDGGTGTNLQGLAHQGYTLGETWLYRNPFGTIPLPDDYIAMASILWSMSHYLDSGESFYSLADGCHDHAISLHLHQAAESGSEVQVSGLPWMTPC